MSDLRLPEQISKTYLELKAFAPGICGVKGRGSKSNDIPGKHLACVKTCLQDGIVVLFKSTFTSKKRLTS
jgi:hypothetical protein